MPLPHNWTLTEKTGGSCSSTGTVISQYWEKKSIDGRKVKFMDVNRESRRTREAEDQESKEITSHTLLGQLSTHSGFTAHKLPHLPK